MGRDQCDGHTVAVGTCCTSDAVDIVLGIVRRVVVDDHLDVIDVNSAAHDVGCNENVDVAVAEVAHDGVALLLGQVAVHCAHTQSFHAERAPQLADFCLLGAENDDAVHAVFSVVERTMLNDAADKVVLHPVVTDIGNLPDFLSRF